ncbi:hypothetical protein HYQ46_009673 [Verticillium longisporum]|nr:hypothetical protein HYQ46_009673 [Verticillium longisporum]
MNDNLLGVLERLLALFALLLELSLLLRLLHELLPVTIESGLGLLDGALGRLLPLKAGSGVFVGGAGLGGADEEQLRAGGLVVVDDVGVGEGLVGGGLGAVGRSFVEAGVGVDVDLVIVEHDALGEVLDGSHRGMSWT